MTSLLSGRHKYLTNKNTKKGQKVRKIIALSALKNGYCRVQILSEAVFLKWYLFFCTLYPQTSWLRKSEQTREKPPKSWDFGGSKPWYLFWLHDMAAEEGFEPSQTESESAVLPLHNSAILPRFSGTFCIIADKIRLVNTFRKKCERFLNKSFLCWYGAAQETLSFGISICTENQSMH